MAGDVPPRVPLTYYQATPPVVQFHVAYRQSPIRRFCRAFTVAILIWFLITLFLESTFDLLRWTHIGWLDDFPVPAHVTVLDCVTTNRWSDERPSLTTGFSYSSETSLQLPLNSDTLFFLSRGPAYGRVNIVSSVEASTVATVDLIASYRDRNVRDAGTEICLVKRAHNELGVGIFTRRWYGFRSAGRSLHYEATVVLPGSGNPRTPREITNFETDVPNTRHRLELGGHIQFLRISLRGSNAPIDVQSLSAQRAHLRTSNSAIQGVFNSSRFLILKTSNAPIRVDVGITNDDSYVSELDMRTSNSKLEVHTSLLSPSDNGGKYLVTAASSNGPLHVDFPTSPLDTTLRLHATTSNSPAFVSLHPAYQGSFALDTSAFSSTIQRREAGDPSGRGRQRTLKSKNYGQGHLRGSVSWSGRDGPGSVTITTSNSQAILEL